MVLEIIDEKNLLPAGAQELMQQVAQECLKQEGVENLCACLTIVDGEEIRALNARTRDTDRETDVLSFPEIKYPYPKTARDCPDRLKKAYDPAYGMGFLGDIVMNIARAQQQAQELGHSVARETGYLTAHAMFHLLGYDHMTDADKPRMREMEKKTMKALKLFRLEAYGMNTEAKELALKSRENSYSPYSHFRVGACLVAQDGELYNGANFENASYGAAICAERCAVSNAIAHGAKRFTQVYIACDKGYAWPCGICRQVLNEFKQGDLEVYTGDGENEWQMKKLSELLPESFGPEALGIVNE